MRLPPIGPRDDRRPSRCCDASRTGHRPNPVAAGETLEFGRFQVLLRRRELLFEAAPIELGTRAFDLLLILLEANGALVTKTELLRRVWPGVNVAEENLKVQICALRKALGEHRDLIRTEVGRGYRFTVPVRSTAVRTGWQPSIRQRHRSHPWMTAGGTPRRSSHGW
jgi:DNA-binding winged helix-turn-helix (wHTH) protein